MINSKASNDDNYTTTIMNVKSPEFIYSERDARTWAGNLELKERE